MPKKNIELLKKLRMRFLRMRHAEHFDMNDVAYPTPCGTSMCIAGHALQLAGYKHSIDRDFDSVNWFTPKGRRVHDVLSTAQRLLGLTVMEAQRCGGQDEYNGLFFRFDLKHPKEAAKVIDKIIQDASGVNTGTDQDTVESSLQH